MKYKYIKTKDCRIVDVSECFIDEEQKYFINVRTGEKTPLSDAIKGTETLEEMGEHYIRTPSAIYDLRDLYVCEELNSRPYALKNSGLCIYKESIVAEADTIPELCDRYYGVDEDGDIVRVHNGSKYAYPSRPNEWAVDGFCTKENITINELKKRFPKGIFGAIVWFDSKGNLHINIVAKMNDKGELELL